MNRSVDFFDAQFERQIRGRDFALNPFEKLALPYLRGRVLDLGCGLGNLAIEAARRGCQVLALDASLNGIGHIRNMAGTENLFLEAEVADLKPYRIMENFDVIVSIGLLMFMESSQAHRLLNEIQFHVRPDGLAIVNVLIEGTTYLEMFEPGRYYLFGENELTDQFAGWEILDSKHETFDAPHSTVKRFATIIARKMPVPHPSSASS
ncbi:MAG: methyltransferase domain-containing protein [Alphaproteobacteria bacterium]